MLRTVTKNFNKLTYMVLNVQGSKDKLIDMDLFGTVTECNVLCLNEHSAKISEIEFLKIQGFKLRNKFCRISHKRGDVVIYVKIILTSIDISNLKVHLTILILRSSAIFYFNPVNFGHTVSDQLNGSSDNTEL